MAGAKNVPSVWVQLEDGRIREFKAFEVRGDTGRGAQVKTPLGGGKVVAHGEPPNGADVKQPNVQPGGAPAATPTLITPQQLNDLVPQAHGITGPKRRLDAQERRIANEVQDALMDVNRGNADAINRLAPYRPHLHDSGEFNGWQSVDLRSENYVGNVMRLYFRKGKDGKFEAKVIEYHGKKPLY